ncbi:hypothetical protein CCACVL1_08993 [Corchorus capsularis]|uniref:Uncharacterized protein n=1 Tax=Corchorus capsularis TaxID=210143 RepID=A0A1R3IY42_COCAP|nr:hypothetical protein CCACVL1_08993 [Corchorus capsularis]
MVKANPAIQLAVIDLVSTAANPTSSCDPLWVASNNVVLREVNFHVFGAKRLVTSGELAGFVPH